MKKRYVIILIILAIALCLRLYRISWNILICDELSSVLWWLDLNFLGKLIRAATIEPSPPLYFIFLHGWIKLFGGTEFVIRLFSVLMGLLSIIMVYLIGKELINIQAGLGGALMMAISPYHIYHTTYARMYALLLFLVLLSYYSFINLLKKNNRKWLWGYILSTTLSLYTHYSALYAILIQNLYFFIFWKGHGKLVRLWIKAQLGVIFCFLPWLPVFLKDLLFSEWSFKTVTAIPFHEKLLFIKGVCIDNFMPYAGQAYFDYSMENFYRWQLLKWILHFPFLLPFINLLVSSAFIVFFIFGLIYLFKEKKRFVFISLFLFTLFFFSLFVSRYNRPRFFFQICPAFYLAVACGILNLKGKIKILSIGIVLLLHFIALNTYYAQIKISHVKSAFAYLKATYQKGDIILINSFDVRNGGTNFWYHNKFQNNSAYDIRLLTIQARQGAVTLEKDKAAVSAPFSCKKYFRPFLEKLKKVCGYKNVEDIYETVSLNELGKKKRVWYVGDENRSFIGKNKKIIELLENLSFTFTSYNDFGATRLYLLQK